MNNDVLVFDAETKSATIDLATLDRTIKLEDYAGRMSESRPIDHSDLIKRIFAIAHNRTEWQPVLSDIVVKHDRCRRIKWTGDNDKCPIENYLIDRLVARIDFKGSESMMDIQDASGVMSAAVSYNEKGIQVGFGHKVSMCQNLNVFGDFVFSTYGAGRNKLNFSKGMELLDKWMTEGMEVRQYNIDAIKKLQNHIVTEDKRLQLFGKMYELAVLANEGNTVEAPLNVTECGKMIKNGFSELTKQEYDLTAWQITNWATNVLRPQSSDMLTLLDKNNRLNNFLLDQFSLTEDTTYNYV